MATQDKLDHGRIESLSLRALRRASTEVIDMVRTEAGYFETNAKRMRYPEFRRQGLFVGTGVMEAGCKTVIGSRLKRLSRSAAASSAAISKTTGRRATPEPHFHVAHPEPLFRRNWCIV
jgi:hypothetical protein